MKKPVIAVDIDEVLVAHSEQLINWYNHRYGTNMTLADNHSEDLNVWGTETKEEAIKRVQEYIHGPNLTNKPPFEEAATVLRKLSYHYKLVVVTSRDTIIEKATRRWLENHFREIFGATHFVAEYNLEGKSTTKAAICTSIGAGYLIDDRLDIGVEVARAGIKVLLFGDYPWNQTGKLPNGIVRVKNWQEVLEYFENESSRRKVQR